MICLRENLKDLDDVEFNLLMILQIESDKRISAEEALKHQYFNG